VRSAQTRAPGSPSIPAAGWHGILDVVAALSDPAATATDPLLFPLYRLLTLLTQPALLQPALLKAERIALIRSRASVVWPPDKLSKIQNDRRVENSASRACRAMG
jgi:hypothetical protein